MRFFWQSLVPNPTGRRCPRGLEVQTLLFPRPGYTKPKAKSWAKGHDFRYGDVDTTAQYHRLRQREPEDFTRGSFRTIDFDNTEGIKAVVGCPRPGMEKDQ